MDRAFVVHAMPGRVRIRIPNKRGDSLYFADLQANLLQCDEVRAVQTNYRVASVLVDCVAAGDFDSIADYAREQGLFALEGELAVSLQTVPEIFSANLNAVNRVLGTFTKSHLDMESIFFLLFVGLGFRQLLRGGIMQPAIPLLWTAVEIMRDLNKGRL